MARFKVPVVGPAYNMRSSQLDAQRSINWYLTTDSTGKYNLALLPRPGLELFVDDEDEKSVRGILSLRGQLYAVIDNTLYICNTGGTRRYGGTLKTFRGQVSIIANQTQLFISDGFFAYIYQLVKTDFHDVGDFFLVEQVKSQISIPIFSGNGIDDLSVSPESDYNGKIEKIYKVQIDKNSKTNDFFKWSDTNGTFWNQENVAITGTDQLLNNGVYIRFNNLVGHLLFDSWTIDATANSAFYPPIRPSYQDGYGIYPRQNTSIFYISANGDFSIVNGAEFAQTSVYPDNLVAAISIHDELYLIGETTTEIWYDTGALEFPFERKRNIVLNYGTEAPFTVQSGADNIIFMLASNYDGGRVVVQIINYNVSIISTEPINEELRLYKTVKDAFAFLLERNGHVFYIITFPSEDRTWVYDLSTSLWHEWRSTRKILETEETKLGKFRGNCHTVFDGQDIIGDAFSGKIFKLSENSNLDYDFPIICERTTQHLSLDNQYLTLNSLQLDFEAGVGRSASNIENPQAMLQISRDGGKTWGNRQWRPLGKTGEFKNRAIWYRLGTARIFTFRVRISDPVYRVILGAIADGEILD